MHAFRPAFRNTLLATFMTGALAGHGHARTLEVGANQAYKLPSAALAAAQPGDTIRIQPGEYFDCATVRVDRLTIEGVGDAAKVLMTDKVCGGKGLLVIDGNDITIRNLTLTRARVPDANGAGIRNEAANLTVDHVRFVNNQDGILSTPNQPGTLTVKDSLFDRNGGCPQGHGCAHGLYASSGTLLHVEHSTFTGTKQGHHIKSRTLHTEIIGCTIEDGPEGTASYLIEQPVGGSLIVRDSTLEKGPHADNHSAAIVIGSEGVTQPTPAITITNNTFRDDGSWPTIFVNNLTATEARLTGNHLTGPVRALSGDGSVAP